MGVHLETWCLEADSADAMVGVEQPVAAAGESGAKGASQERSFNFRRSASRRTRQLVHLLGNGLPIPGLVVAMQMT